LKPALRSPPSPRLVKILREEDKFGPCRLRAIVSIHVRVLVYNKRDFGHGGEWHVLIITH